MSHASREHPESYIPPSMTSSTRTTSQTPARIRLSLSRTIKSNMEAEGSFRSVSKTPNIVQHVVPAAENESSPPMVTINLISGNLERAVFVVYRSHLCFFSSHFASALSQNPDGTTFDIHTHPQVPAAIQFSVFGIFSNWLYTQSLCDQLGQAPTLLALVHLWVLGQNLGVPKLQDQVLTTMDKERMRLHTVPPIQDVYKLTDKGSPLRQYVVALCATGFSREIMQADGYTPEMLIDMVNYTRKHHSQPWIQFHGKELESFFVGKSESDTIASPPIDSHNSTPTTSSSTPPAPTPESLALSNGSGE